MELQNSTFKAIQNKNYTEIYITNNKNFYETDLIKAIRKANIINRKDKEFTCPIFSILIKRHTNSFITSEVIAKNNFFYLFNNYITNQPNKYLEQEINELANYYQKMNEKNYKRTIQNFKEKYNLNFESNKKITFYTFTIHTDKNFNKNKNKWEPTNDAYIKEKYNVSSPNDFKIKKIQYEQAINYKYVKKLFASFIIKLRQKKIITNQKYTYIMEQQKRGVWHIHLVGEKFIKHDGKCYSGFYNNKYISCYECNKILGKKWKYGYCTSQKITNNTNIKTRTDLKKYLIKYLYKNFNAYNFNYKKYIFSNNCENIKIIKTKIFTNINILSNNEIEAEKKYQQQQLSSNNLEYDIILMLENNNKTIKKIIKSEIINPIDFTKEIKYTKKYKIYKSNKEYKTITSLINKINTRDNILNSLLFAKLNFANEFNLNFWELYKNEKKIISETQLKNYFEPVKLNIDYINQTKLKELEKLNL